MNIDYVSSPSFYINLTNRFRVPQGYGKIKIDLSKGDNIFHLSGPRSGNDQESEIKPCFVRLKNCRASRRSGLFWQVKKVKLQDNTVELQYDGVEIEKTEAKVKADTRHLMLRQEGELLENENLHTCGKCGYSTKTLKYYRSHMLTHYTEVFNKVLPRTKPFICPLCYKTHSVRLDLLRHYAVHGKVFEMTNLTPDELKYPKKNQSFDCLKRDRKFKNRLNMRRHLLTHYYNIIFKILPTTKPFVCPVCERTFCDRLTLARHYAFKHRKVFQLTDSTPEDWKWTEKKKLS